MQNRTSSLATFFILFTCAAATLSAQEVTLPLSRYEELRELSQPVPKPEPKPPVAVAFEKARLDVDVDVSSARITQELTLEVYGDGWQTVPLTQLGTYIDSDFGSLEARLDGTDLRVRGRGHHVVRLVSVVAVTPDETATRPTRTLELEAPRAALVVGKLHVGETGAVDEVEARGSVLLGEEDASIRSWVAEPGAGFGFTLYGAAVVPERSRLPLRFDAVSAAVLEVSRTRRQLDAYVTVKVLQGELETLRVSVPDGFEVVDVSGPLAGWDVADGHVVATPLAPVTDRLDLGVRLTGPPAAEMASPVPEVADAANLLLATKVRVDGDAFLNLLDQGAGRQPDARQTSRLPSSFRAADGLALVVPRDGAAPRWQVAWPESTEVLAAQVDRLVIDVVAGTAGRAAYQVWAEVRSSGAPRLVLSLPGAELVSGWRDGVTLVPGQSADGWVVPLSSTTDTQVVHLEMLLPLEVPLDGRGSLQIPVPAFSAPVAGVEARAVLPAGCRYELADASRAGHVAQPPAIVQRAGASVLGQQLTAGVAPSASPDPGRAFFETPAGFAVLMASWSALSPTPTPLEILVKPTSSRKEWF